MKKNDLDRQKVAVRRGRNRLLPVGAELTNTGASFRVWAPARKEVSVVVEGLGEFPLVPEKNGYFNGEIGDAVAGARYRFRLDGGTSLFPDPASRSQPEGPHGASALVDPARFAWSDTAWKGVRLKGSILYEMHVGTFTPEGSWNAAARHLSKLKGLGIDVIEMLPVAEFPGAFGWGYDGVDLFAPAHVYGTPEDLKGFIDTAHGLGIGVILDVVYNHFGPDGCYVREFSPSYFTKRYNGDWGEPLNFDGKDALGVREFILANARYWIREFHFDGLRLDATQQIYDSSKSNIQKEIAQTARDAATGRSIILIAENEPQNTKLIRALENGGYGIDALWNDDFHHSAMVAMTGHREAYYSDTAGAPQEFISAAKYGYLFQGQRYAWQKHSRGTASLDFDPARFVLFLQNHDQIANSARGERFHLLTTPGRARAMTALTLLLPGTPMLFQGQEFWASSPFFYFADHKPELARMVEDGRLEFLTQFPSLANKAIAKRIALPGDPQTFSRSKLDWLEFERHSESVALHRDLIALRRGDPVFARQERGTIDGAVIAQEAFLLRFFGEGGDDRLLLVNLGADLRPASIAEPLLAPPEGKKWKILWSSEDPRYGGAGVAPFEMRDGYFLAAHSALALAPRAVSHE